MKNKGLSRVIRSNQDYLVRKRSLSGKEKSDPYVEYRLSRRGRQIAWIRRDGGAERFHIVLKWYL